MKKTELYFQVMTKLSSLPDTYLEIVASYAKKYGVAMDREKLDRLAVQWALAAGGRNGRIAEQFVRSLLGESGVVP